MSFFTAESLPSAIRALFEMNQYDVHGPIQIRGAEIDLVAKSKTDPFGPPIYIEATVEYVDNDKYGKDIGKLAMVGELEPGAQRLIISSRGFSLPVKERAEATRIRTLTYDELFRAFERFEDYLASISPDTSLGKELLQLNTVYEEPLFADSLGIDDATSYLTRWRDDPASPKGWMVITGEYGTGKTALTKILQYRWLQEYKHNPSLPLPFRIELRDFSRQFDARGLLHHFLDHNNLSHIPIDFVQSLIHSGRLVLLLDGYDEMAQYLHARERRACLEALADLSQGGAKGILTSRPNYFTETEELQVFEILYASIKHGNYYLGQQDRALLEKEERVDQLLGQFIDRFERILKDLSPEQTEALISRVLSDDAAGRDVVLAVLSRTFRTLERGDSISLSGKPVIISYLLEVVEDLKKAPEAIERTGSLTEWQIYKLIIDQLMIRDLKRSSDVNPEDRRKFLRSLAMFLSKKDNKVANEADFKDLVAKEFRREITRYGVESRANEIERYFANLRSSTTLTRAPGGDSGGWRFSHNSLREYLVAEHLLDALQLGQVVTDRVPVSDAMRVFVASRTEEDLQKLLSLLARAWKRLPSERQRGSVLNLLWDGVCKLFVNQSDPRRACLESISGDPIALNDIDLARITLSDLQTPTCLDGASFANSGLYDVYLTGASLRRTDFTGAMLENVNLSNADLREARFRGAIIVDIDMSSANVADADFSAIDPTYTSILLGEGSKNKRRLEGVEALGFLRFHGARTAWIPESAVLKHHPKYAIVEKIIEKLAEQSMRQRRGLEQRGAAQADIAFARAFVRELETNGLIAALRHRKDMIEVTERGRTVFGQFVQSGEISEEIRSFLLKS